jgi:hypothetical protein
MTHQPITDLEVLSAMVKHGGSFAQALAGAWLRADPINSAKLKAAFPDLWGQYEEFVQMRRKSQ